MATLKEAVESGRRWRYRPYAEGNAVWYGPGTDPLAGKMWTTIEAASSDFEIEPEQRCGVRCLGTDGHVGACYGDSGEGLPREWMAHVRNGILFRGHLEEGGCDDYKHVRVHDADACDRQRGQGQRK